MSDNIRILTIIPARGGSKGIPRKNVRLLNGKPLMAYSIEAALDSQFSMDVCVTTDDEEVKNIGEKYGAEVVVRGEELSSDEIPLDPVIYDAYNKMIQKNNTRYDLIITLQPTSPLLTANTLDKAINQIINNTHVDTLISAQNVPHLSWKFDNNNNPVKNYEERKNRQYLPAHFTETGAFLISRDTSITKDSRIGNNVDIYEVPSNESIDIDTPQDWWIAEGELTKKNILIRVEGNSVIGLGHVYRGLSLAYRLINHNIHFLVSESSKLAIEKLNNSFFPYTVIENNQSISKIIETFEADIIINDMLDTTEDYIRFLKSLNVRVINFEDLGQGADLADAVINDLYEEENRGDHFYWGSDYYILRDEFLLSEPSAYNEKVKNILIIFGGVDPSDLTRKIFDVIPKIKFNNEILFTIIVGPGYKDFENLEKDAKSSMYEIEVIQNVKNMSFYMSRADLAVSSQGRTMLELASMGVPTILMAQNPRELDHEFGYLNNGFINLGLGKELKPETIVTTFNWIIETDQIRKQMHNQMLHKDLRHGIDKVLQIILEDN